MNNKRRFQHPEPGPLPADVQQDLRKVDIQLQREARRVLVPQGLADRVFNASAGLLPARSRAPQVEVLATISEFSESIRSGPSSKWGRLAMAASLALVAFIAFDVSQSPALPQMVASIDTKVQDTYRDVVGKTISEMNSLFVTCDVTFDDLDSELATLAADLDM